MSPRTPPPAKKPAGRQNLPRAPGKERVRPLRASSRRYGLPLPKERPHIAQCMIQFSMSPSYGCLHWLSNTFPQAAFRVESYLLWSNEALSVIRFSGTVRTEEVLAFLRHQPDVHETELIYSRGGESVLWVRWDIPPFSLARIANELHLLPHFPIRIHDGVLRVSVSASPDQLRRFYVQLRRQGAPNARVVSMRPEYPAGPVGLLTERQQEIFRLALREGYWDRPHRVTLSELAAMVHVSKSSIAETLAHIEMKLMREAATGPSRVLESVAEI